MRYLLLSLLLASAVYSQTVQGYVTNSNYSRFSTIPDDVAVYELVAKYTRTSNDTIGADTSVVYGPFPLHNGNGAFKYLQIDAGASIAASGDSVAVGYTMTTSNQKADINSWTYLDTLDSNVETVTPVVDISDEPGAYIWFILTNIDGTAVQLADYLRAIMKSGASFIID